MDRKKRILELRDKGLSYQAIATVFGISRQRVHQLSSDYKQLRNGHNSFKGWYVSLRMLVLDRDEHKCQKCDCADTLVIHHIGGSDLNNDLSNLITLCRACHQRLHKPGCKSRT